MRQLVPVFPCILFRPFSFGDVFNHAESVECPSFLITNERSGEISPNLLAVFLDVTLFLVVHGDFAGKELLHKGYVFFEDKKYPWAYTYRDYVVRALNEDLPYDRFITEQLAADRLDLGEDKRPLAAMGVLTVGDHFMNNVHDILDDQLDVASASRMAWACSNMKLRKKSSEMQ